MHSMFADKAASKPLDDVIIQPDAACILSGERRVGKLSVKKVLYIDYTNSYVP